MYTEKTILQGYEYAKEIYAFAGVDTEKAIAKVNAIPISMHCWQGDDVAGFDGAGELSGGIAATGNYPGKARSAQELRCDIDEAFSLIPGTKKLNLHSSYAELNGQKIGRDAYTVRQFEGWVNWALSQKIGMDFNPTYFSHPMMDGNFSLASANNNKRIFWIEHGKRCREIGEQFGKLLGKPCVVNFWMPDGYKDIPADTQTPRERMTRSLDEIFAPTFSEEFEIDALESKLFGLGVESYTVASHEYSLGYAISRNKTYCLDCGHFHPTETVSAKISAVLQFVPKILLHISRGVRWDSDHVALWDDELQSIMNEVIRRGYETRTFIALDYFDASINRIASWVIGMRNARKSLLKAMLEPINAIAKAETEGDFTSRLALLEEAKTLPFSAVWDYYCLQQNVPVGSAWLDEVKHYERDNISRR